MTAKEALIRPCSLKNIVKGFKVCLSLFCDNCSYTKPSAPPPHDRSFGIIIVVL